jgi:hypothetical protein
MFDNGLASIRCNLFQMNRPIRYAPTNDLPDVEVAGC